MAAAYTDWLIAANGIASDLATSRSGILLLVLLLLLILQGSRADVTPALGEEPAENAARAGGPGDGRCTPIVLGAKLWSTQPTDDQHHEMSKAPGNPESTLGPTRLGTASVDGPWPPAGASWRRATTWLSMHG